MTDGRARSRRWRWTIAAAAAVAVLFPLHQLDSRAWGLLNNTLLLVAGTLAISLPLGIVLAWLLVRSDLPGRKAALVVLASMLFVPLYLQAAAWQAGFGLQGWYTLVFQTAEARQTWVLLEGWRGAIWIHAVAALPWTVLIVGGGFWLVEPELEEQAALDAGPWFVFVRVTLRSALSAILIAALWVTIITAGEITVTDLFGVRTYAEEVYVVHSIGPDPDEPMPGALPGVYLTAWLVVAGLTLAAKLAPGDRPMSVRPCRTVLGFLRWPAAIGVAILFAILVGVPLGDLAYQAGVLVTQGEAGRVRTWSLAKATSIVLSGPREYSAEFQMSLLLGTLAATTAVVLGAWLAWVARRGRAWPAVAMVLCAFGLAVPGPLVGLAVIRCLNQKSIPLLLELYDNSVLAPWLALTFRSFAPALLILWHAFRTVPSAMLDAAAVDGASGFARFWRIVLPSRMAAVAMAWLVALAVSLGDLAASILVVPPGTSTLSIQIFNLLHYGVYDQVAGICLALVGLFAALAAGIVWLGSAFRRS